MNKERIAERKEERRKGSKEERNEERKEYRKKQWTHTERKKDEKKNHPTSEEEDNFDKIYKGEVSKSGTPVLPSKRTRRIPEKINPNYNNLKDKNEDKNEEPKQQEDSKSLATDIPSQE